MAAYEAWPSPAHDKTLLRALILRVQIEQVVASLPPSVIAAPPDIDSVERRLMLAVGEPGLDRNDRERRLRVVRSGVTSYKQICDVLHGRNPGQHVSPQQLELWSAAARDLVDEFVKD